jgi:hypothetical protein
MNMPFLVGVDPGAAETRVRIMQVYSETKDLV